jgi:Uma2 family endonuclease
MNVQTKPRMTVDEFLAWAEARPGRYELFRGEVFPMSPEVVGHTKVKGMVFAALLAGIRQRALPCQALTDGATVRVDELTAYEPDALVYCRTRLSLLKYCRRRAAGSTRALSLGPISGCRA